MINIFEFFKFKYIYELLLNIHADRVSTRQSSKNSNQNNCDVNENNIDNNINNEIDSRTIIVDGNSGKNESIIFNNNKENKENLLVIKTKISNARKELGKDEVSERQNIKFASFEQKSKNKNSDEPSNNSIHCININLDNSNMKFKNKKSLYNFTESNKI